MTGEEVTAELDAAVADGLILSWEWSEGLMEGLVHVAIKNLDGYYTHVNVESAITILRAKRWAEAHRDPEADKRLKERQGFFAEDVQRRLAEKGLKIRLKSEKREKASDER